MKTQIGLLVVLFALVAHVSTKLVGQTRKAEAVAAHKVMLKLIDDVEVSVEEPGLVTEMKAEAGKLVKAGELLAKTNDQEQQLKKGKAEIELKNSQRLAKNRIKIQLAKKSWQVADTELKRGLDSAKRYKKSVSATEIDRLRLAEQRAKLEIDQAEYDHQTAKLAVAVNRSELDLAKHMAKRRQVLSPIDGMVVMVQRKKGEWVKPGESFVRIVSTKRLRAETFVPAKELDKIKIGQKVTLRVGKQRTYSGKVVFVSPEVTPSRGEGRVWAEISNADGKLRPGQHGSLVIHTGGKSENTK